MRHIQDQDLPLLDVLGLVAPGSSKSTRRQWLAHDQVTVDGRNVRDAKALVRAGQEVCVGDKQPLLPEKVRIIYEDRHIVAIDKPTGLLSVASDRVLLRNVHAILKRHYRPNRIYVVHRLDQDTSGVMVFALTEEACLGLKTVFKTHSLDRRYIALVEGEFEQKEGSWESYLWEDQALRVHSSDDPKSGKRAVTHYRVTGSRQNVTRLEVTLETGRKNQIRVQSSTAGHPVVGDTKYGASSDPLKRLGLHAEYLSFAHPITGKQMAFTSPLPKRFDRVVAQAKTEK